MIPQSLGLFVVAGLCEISGGYLVWQALREGRGAGYAVAGAAVLVLYGVIPTLQPEPAFGRVYAAYGGCFVVLAMVWGTAVDRWSPDGWDLAGTALALTGMAVMMWAPRH